CNVHRKAEAGRNCGPLVSAESCGAAGHCTDDPATIHHPDPVIAGIRDEHITGRVYGDTARSGKLSRNRRTAITAEPRGAARQCGNPSGSSDHSDPIVVLVRNEEVPRQIDSDRSGVVQLRSWCWTAVAAESCVPGACYSADHTCRSHLPNLIVARIGN